MNCETRCLLLGCCKPTICPPPCPHPHPSPSPGAGADAGRARRRLCPPLPRCGGGAVSVRAALPGDLGGRGRRLWRVRERQQRRRAVACMPSLLHVLAFQPLLYALYPLVLQQHLCKRCRLERLGRNVSRMQAGTPCGRAGGVKQRRRPWALPADRNLPIAALPGMLARWLSAGRERLTFPMGQGW